MSASQVSSIEEALADQLEATGRYRVLRPLPELPALAPSLSAGDIRMAVALDVESTGIGPGAEVIELAMVRFAYSPFDGSVLGVLGTFSRLRQPTCSIPPEVTRLTGLDDRAVSGSFIDGDEVASFLHGARLVIAHNAVFDRPLAETVCPQFAGLPWACSCTEIDWRAEGFESARLGQLVLESGFHFGGHRALNDVLATLNILSLPLPASGRIGLAALLEHARAPSFRVSAEKAPYAAKDALRQRGYRWSNGDEAGPPAWYRDLTEDALEAELTYLRREIYRDARASPTVTRSTAFDRFSRRTAPIVTAQSSREA